MKKFLKYWLPFLFWAFFIFFASSIASSDIPDVFSGQDTLFHIFEYTILALLLNRALKNSGSSALLRRPRRIFLVILSCFIYALSDELHQIFVPGRTNSMLDLFFDGFGILIGSVIYR